jgi:hypothetical protein
MIDCEFPFCFTRLNAKGGSYDSVASKPHLLLVVLIFVCDCI